MFATRLRIDFTPFDSTLPGFGRSAAVTSSRLESSEQRAVAEHAAGVANCAFPEILRPSDEDVVAPTDLRRHAELAQHLDHRAG